MGTVSNSFRQHTILAVSLTSRPQQKNLQKGFDLLVSSFLLLFPFSFRKGKAKEKNTFPCPSLSPFPPPKSCSFLTDRCKFSTWVHAQSFSFAKIPKWEISGYNLCIFKKSDNKNHLPTVQVHNGSVTRSCLCPTCLHALYIVMYRYCVLH